MKPHFKKHQGLWYCRGDAAIGLGYTPKKAFDDWVMQVIKQWRKVAA